MTGSRGLHRCPPSGHHASPTGYPRFVPIQFELVIDAWGPLKVAAPQIRRADIRHCRNCQSLRRRQFRRARACFETKPNRAQPPTRRRNKKRRHRSKTMKLRPSTCARCTLQQENPRGARARLGTTATSAPLHCRWSWTWAAPRGLSQRHHQGFYPHRGSSCEGMLMANRNAVELRPPYESLYSTPVTVRA